MELVVYTDCCRRRLTPTSKPKQNASFVRRIHSLIVPTGFRCIYTDMYFCKMNSSGSGEVDAGMTCGQATTGSELKMDEKKK